MRILWSLELNGIALCDGLLDELDLIDNIDQATLDTWAGECQAVENALVPMETMLQDVYFFKPDTELTLEFIQIRDWLIEIGCPMSLVYRI